MQNVESLMSEVQKLHEQMSKLTLEAGVGEKRYASLVKKTQKAAVLRVSEFLHDVSKNEYFEVHRIWNLPSMTDEVWNNYLVLFDDVDFPEMKLLRNARRELRGRYSAFFKPKKRKA